MSEESQKSDARKSGTSEMFRLRRKSARKRAMQFLYGLDIRKEWAFTADQLAVFKEMLTDLDEDTETLPESELKKALTYMDTLVHGVVENIDDIDEKIRAAAKNWRLERMDAVDKCILRVAVFEMAHIQNVSGATAIDEAVELSKSFGQAETPRFVNGVLDRIWRSLDNDGKAVDNGTEGDN
ncbi:MAG: transcription antitermination factor NusB [Victivallales bacterium]|nr:transcription antitermination factor NusB [Victivallales bacterium]